MTETAAGQGWVPDPRFELNELRRPVFTTLRKGGLDPEQVEQYVVRLEKLAKEFAKFTRELETRISHAQAETREARLAERKAVDDAMLAAFDAKERIILQAEERAWEIEEEAHRRASAIVASVGAEGSDDEAVALRSEAGALRTRVEDLEIQLDQWKKRAGRAEASRADTGDANGATGRVAADVDVALAQVETLHAAADAARADRDRLAAELDEARSQLHEARSAESGIAAGADAVQADRDRLAGEVEGLRAELARVRGEQATLAEAEAAQLGAAADAARAERDRLAGELQAVRAELDEVRAAESDRATGADAARAEAETARSEAEAARAEAEEMRAEAEKIRQDADAAQAAAEQARQEAARMLAEAEALRRDDEDVNRKSRYARNSAQLPSIGEGAGEVLHSVGDLRKRRPPAANQGE